MRILVTGASGQLGSELVAHCEQFGDEVIAATRDRLDIGDRDAVLGVVTSLRPDVVVNTAAWTAVDACEGDVDRALRDNAMAVRWLREGCAIARTHLVQISTDYVFDGTADRPYHEWDRPNPLSVYGISKRGGEIEAGNEATIVRSSWVCGARGPNMVNTVLRLLDSDAPLAFVDDQFGCPTFAPDLAEMVRRLAVARRSGVYHVTNQGAVSWFEFVREIVIQAGRDPDIVSPISTSELDPPRPAARPANGVLDNVALRGAGLPEMRGYRDPLAELVSALRA